MLKILGVRMNKHPFDTLTKVGDVILKEKSRVSVYTNEDKEPYFYIWVDANEDLNRWLVFRTTKNLLAEYLNGDLSLHELVMKPADLFVYSVDIDDDGNFTNPRLNSTTKLPGPYQQSKADFIEPEHAPDFAKIKAFFGV